MAAKADSTTPTEPKPAEPSKEVPQDDPFAVFDGPVNETAKASGKPAPKTADGGTAPDAPPKKRGRPRKKPTPEEVEESERKAKLAALGIVGTINKLQIATARRKYQKHLEPAQLARVLETVAFTPEEMADIAQPLAEGLIENGVEMPWEMRLAFAALVPLGRGWGVMGELDQHLKRQVVEGEVIPATKEQAK